MLAMFQMVPLRLMIYLARDCFPQLQNQNIDEKLDIFLWSRLNSSWRDTCSISTSFSFFIYKAVTFSKSSQSFCIFQRREVIWLAESLNSYFNCFNSTSLAYNVYSAIFNRSFISAISSFSSLFAAYLYFFYRIWQATWAFSIYSLKDATCFVFLLMSEWDLCSLVKFEQFLTIVKTSQSYSSNIFKNQDTGCQDSALIHMIPYLLFRLHRPQTIQTPAKTGLVGTYPLATAQSSIILVIFFFYACTNPSFMMLRSRQRTHFLQIIDLINCLVSSSFILIILNKNQRILVPSTCSLYTMSFFSNSVRNFCQLDRISNVKYISPAFNISLIYWTVMSQMRATYRRVQDYLEALSPA